jgi:hypothetical protein
LSESWNNNFIGGYDKQIEDRGLQGGLSLQLILKQPNALPATGYTTGNLNFISVGLDPFTQGNKLSYSTLYGQCYKKQ